MSPELKNFINQNIELINENSKESWEKIYEKLNNTSWLTGEFTKMILDARINDPAEVLGYVPENYLKDSEIEKYKIPNSLTSIRKYAFANCKLLTSIEIPDSVTSIGGGAFLGCQSLTSIVIPNSVINIGGYAFQQCVSLKSVDIPDSVTDIGIAMFDNCSSLKYIKIPNNVTDIGYGAFFKCTSLTSIEIPNSVTSIGEDAFYGCRSLEEIQFKGTKKQAIDCGIGSRGRKKWRANSAIKKIICSDGEIIL